MTIKEQLRRAIDTLPDDASFEEAMDRLYLLYKVQRGTEQLDAGQAVPDDEARKRILGKWAK
jgi:hypothetical protein